MKKYVITGAVTFSVKVESDTLLEAEERTKQIISACVLNSGLDINREQVVIAYGEEIKDYAD